MRPLIIVLMAGLMLQCQGGTSLDSLECRSDLECPIGSSCDPWTRTCVAVQKPGEVDPVPPGEPSDTVCKRAGDPCDDRDGCTSNDTCDADLACGGTPYSCDDGFDCTLDTCDGRGACTYKVLAASCLIDGVCVALGAARATSPCQACLPSIDLFTWSNNNAGACDDGDACTTADQCDGGGCVGGPAPDCDDGVDCTVDSCDVSSGCQSVANNSACDDGVECTTDTCGAEGCDSAVDDAACDDGHSCSSDACDASAGCQYTLDDVACDDGVVCTVDTCVATTGCASSPDHNTCDDSLPCTNDECTPTAGCTNTIDCPEPAGDCASAICEATGCEVSLDDASCDDADPDTVDSCDEDLGCLNVAS